MIEGRSRRLKARAGQRPGAVVCNADDVQSAAGSAGMSLLRRRG